MLPKGTNGPSASIMFKDRQNYRYRTHTHTHTQKLVKTWCLNEILLGVKMDSDPTEISRNSGS